MRLDDHLVGFELQALFERGRHIEPVADVTRARALARARAMLAVAHDLPASPVTVPGRTPRLQIALAAVGAFILGATGAAAAFFGHASSPRVPTAPAVERQEAPAAAAVQEASAAPRRAAHPMATVVSRRRTGSDDRRGATAAELGLLRRAQTAYAEGRFAEVLELVAAHAHRFPDGQLAEEREALRVRSLVGCGRLDAARRAAEAFADRFPHSVLLARLQSAVQRGG